MRLLAIVLALLALPLAVKAQDAEEAAAPEPNAEDLAPPSESAPEQPALQLKLEDAGIEVTPSPSETFFGYTLEELELRKRRAGLGLIAPAALVVAGVPPLVLGTNGDRCVDVQDFDSDYCRRLRTAGLVLTISGTVGMIVGFTVLGVRGRALRWAESDKYIARGPPRGAGEYTLEEMEFRVKRARRGLFSSTGMFVLGGIIIGLAPTASDEYGTVAIVASGVAVMGAGSLGMIVSGAVLGARKRQLRELKQGRYGKPRRLQWDLARSRLVF